MLTSITNWKFYVNSTHRWSLSLWSLPNLGFNTIIYDLHLFDDPCFFNWIQTHSSCALLSLWSRLTYYFIISWWSLWLRYHQSRSVHLIESSSLSLPSTTTVQSATNSNIDHSEFYCTALVRPIHKLYSFTEAHVHDHGMLHGAEWALIQSNAYNLYDIHLQIMCVCVCVQPYCAVKVYHLSSVHCQNAPSFSRSCMSLCCVCVCVQSFCASYILSHIFDRSCHWCVFALICSHLCLTVFICSSTTSAVLQQPCCCHPI